MLIILNHEIHEKSWGGLASTTQLLGHGRDTDGTRTGHGRDTDGTRTACERINLTVVFMDFMGYPRSRICPCLVRVQSISIANKLFHKKQDSG